MIIVIAGLKRSGSTAQFNMVRLALEMAGYNVNVHGSKYKPRETDDVDLVKIHKFRKELADAADHVFLTDRPWKDILDSLERFNGNRPDPRRPIWMYKHQSWWAQYSTPAHYFPYRMLDDLPEYARQVCKVLDVSVDVDMLVERFENVEPPKSGHDPKTFLFSNHITK